MKYVVVTIMIEGIKVNVKLYKNTNYRILKEQLRDALCPILKNPNQNWGALVERIRDSVIPKFL